MRKIVACIIFMISSTCLLLPAIVHFTNDHLTMMQLFIGIQVYLVLDKIK